METKINFSKGSAGFIRKLQFSGGSLPLERALMHYGYATYGSYGGTRSKAKPAVKHFVQWARQQPWLRVEDEKICIGGCDRASYRFHLVAENLPESGRAAS